jgi:hypothetical protein
VPRQCPLVVFPSHCYMFALQCQVVFEGICFGHVLSIACQYM